MKAVKQFIKRRYLAQTVITCIAFMLIPFIIFSYTVIYRSCRELSNANEEYYKKTTNAFAKYFQAQMAEIQTNALKISEDAKEIDSPLRLSILQSNPYYFMECVDFLRQYSITSKYPMGIYYYETGYLLTKDTNYTLQAFMKSYLEIENEEAIPGLRDFFTYNPQKSFKLFSTFSNHSSKEFFLAGVTIRIGNTQDKALIFYMLEPSSIDTSLFSSQSSYGAQYYIIDSDSDTLLYTTAQQYDSLTADEIQILLGNCKNGAARFESGDKRFNAYAVHDSAFGRDYISLVPYDAVESTIYQFVSTMRKMAFAASVVFLFLLCIMLYINYRPIQKIMGKLNKNAYCNEIKAISSTFDEMSNEMSEQNLLIMDFLLNSILCGTPIPANEKDRLGISSHIGNFCVYTVEGLELSNEQRSALTCEIADKFDITAYITDIFGIGRNVIILQLENEETCEIVSYIESRLSSCFNKTLKINVGIIVKSIDDIQKSYASCIMANNPTGGSDNSPDLYKQAADSIERENKKSSRKISLLKDRVIEYIQQNFTDPAISQISVADHFGISIYTLSRLFKNHIGLGFSEYITAKRLEYAKNLLLTTDKTIAEISNEIGISNVNYFSRLIKSNFGVSPMKFRSSMGSITR